MKQPALLTRQGGLTLLETLVAIAIFMVIMTAIMNMFPTVFKVNRQTRADQSTTIAAKSYMEDMRSYLQTPANFAGTGVLPAPTGLSDGYTCTSAMASVQSAVTKTGVSAAMIKRVTMTCTRTGDPTLVFTQDFGNPEFPILAPVVGGS